VSFRPVSGAKKYEVVVYLQDGLRTEKFTTGHSLTLSVPTAGPLGGSVFVRALGNNLTTDDGNIVTARILLTKSVKSRLAHARGAIGGPLRPVPGATLLRLV
jgi:hypothetical protein